KLLTRGTRVGFFSPSLEGGLLLLLLFNPSRRSSSPTRSCSAATRAFSATFSARNAEFSCRRPLGGAIPSVDSDSPSRHQADYGARVNWPQLRPLNRNSPETSPGNLGSNAKPSRLAGYHHEPARHRPSRASAICAAANALVMACNI